MGTYRHSVGSDAKNREAGIVSAYQISWRKVLTQTAIVGVALATLTSIPFAVDKYFDMKDRGAIVDNFCTPGEVVATDNSSYRGWAAKAINKSKDLGDRVGVNRLSNILEKDNKYRSIVVGEKYDTLNCLN